MSDTGAPFHYGGPLGLGALVAVAGAAGVYIFTSNGPDLAEETNLPTPVPITSEETDTDENPPEPQPQPKPPSEAAEDTPALKKIVPDQIKTPNLPDISPSVKPALPTVRGPLTGQPSQVQTLPAQAKDTEIIFIVRIKGSDDIDEAARLFKKDRAAAIKAFARYVETAPALKDFTLIGGSYSGEIRLAYTLPQGTEPHRATINKIKDTLMSVDGVSYADPDFVAHPGKE